MRNFIWADFRVFALYHICNQSLSPTAGSPGKEKGSSQLAQLGALLETFQGAHNLHHRDRTAVSQQRTEDRT